MEQLQTLAPISKRLRRVKVETNGTAATRNGKVTNLSAARQAKRAEAEATYKAALELVKRIDHELTYGLRHYRTKAGRLLLHLDEVIEAILGDDLLLEPELDGTWEPVQEMVA